jgi:predicted ATPase/DNA-binding CsgD family transcriptional regulator
MNTIAPRRRGNASAGTGREGLSRAAVSSDALNSELASFVGREAELARLLEVRTTTRVLTLVGPGGVGKTRLAARLASAVRDAFPAGVWSVDLSELPDAAHVPEAVADVLQIRERVGQPWSQILADELLDRRLLLVLDNCERLVAAAAELAVALLHACAGVEILSTSREPLGVDGEVVWRVPSLSLPPPEPTGLRQIRATEAARLFVTRARAHLPDFVLNEQNASAVALICRRLAGLPLALELLAAHVPRLGLNQIASHLDTRYALRVSATRAAPARQHTLRASLDWSYALLPRPERVLFRRLGVFVGGFTLDAAEAVCADERLPAALVVDLLDRLVSRSLVMVDHQATSVRYRLLDITRQYALELLRRARELELVQRRHADYVVVDVSRTHPARLDLDHAIHLERDQGNLRAALRWALQQGEGDLACRLAIAGFTFWYLRGRYIEGQAWLMRCLALPAPAGRPELRAFVGTLAGHLSLLVGDFATAQALLEEALEVQRGLGNQEGVALALHFLSLVAAWRGDLLVARRRSEEGQTAFAAVATDGPLPRLIRSALLTTSARIAWELGDERRARVLAARAEDVARAHADQFWLGRALHLQALLAMRAGEHVSALQLAGQALALQRAHGDNEGLLDSLCTLGNLELDRGGIRQGWAAFAEAVRTADQAGDRVGFVCALEGFARAMAVDQPEDAVRLAASCETMREALGCPPWPAQRRRNTASLARARAGLGGTAYANARAEGRRGGPTEAMRRAHELASMSGVTAGTGGPLTPREHQVAVLLAQGLSNKDIAATLAVSVGTVRSHVDHILAKLGLHSRAQVAVWAIHRDAAAP